MNTDPIPKNLIAVHDLLTETIAIAQDNGLDFGYGMAFFPRTGRFDAPVFGVVTRGGESTTLTYRLLHALLGQTVHVSGRVPASVRDGMTSAPGRIPPAALLDQPPGLAVRRCGTARHREAEDGRRLLAGHPARR